MQILTMATCHNRCAQSVSALADLYAQILPAGVSVSHLLVDDGSTDGTAEAVRKKFPDVDIITGDGNLYWAGGMRFGWDRSARDRKFDYLFVYNDDVRLDKRALALLLESASSEPSPVVVTGAFAGEDGAGLTYGGRRRSSRWHPLKFDTIVTPNGSVQEAETLNMNGALISRKALEAVGFLSGYFVHSGADFEYGLKLRKAGGKVLVAPEVIGRCDLNPQTKVSPTQQPTLKGALAMLLDPKREPFRQRLGYYRRHAGVMWPLYWVTPYMTVWFSPFRKH